MIIVLAIAGMVLLIPLTLFLALFVENILFLDTLLVSVLCTAWLWSASGIHPAFCILFGIGILVALMLLYTQKYMFWIFTVLSGTIWGLAIGYLLHDITNDWIWGIFIGVVVSIIVWMLHLYARMRVCG